MGTDLVTLEQQFKPLVPQLTQALAGRMPTERLVRTVLVSVQKTPKLLECSQQSIFNSAMSAAVLGLEVDGVTGQAFLIPYGGSAQLVIGYKGMNTLGARSGYTITASTVREGDKFEYELGSGAYVRHKPLLGNKGRIIAAWACATSKQLEPIVGVLSIDEIEAIKKKSPGAKKSDSPWNDSTIGYLAMAEKSARRRLARSMPLNADTREYHYAARMDEAFEEQGRVGHITPEKGVIIEGEIVESPLPDREPASEAPSAADLTAASAPRDRAVEQAKAEGLEAADGGTGTLRAWWVHLPKPLKEILAAYKDETLKPLADKADVGE